MAREEQMALCFITDADQRVLLMQRRDPWQLQLPGGRVEEGEVPAQAAIRELHEELDIAVTALHRIGSNVFEQAGTNYFYELFRVTQFEGIPRLSEPQIYHDTDYYNLARYSVKQIGLSAVAENVCTLIQNGELQF